MATTIAGETYLGEELVSSLSPSGDVTLYLWPMRCLKTKIGGPTFGVDVVSDADMQAAYLAALFDEAELIDAKFIVWFALVDYDALWNGVLQQDPIAHIWRDIGLYDESLNPRTALDIWQAELVLPVQ